MKARFHIVTPSYNQAVFLEKTIISVLSQKEVSLQYFVIDGGSSDDSVSIIKTHAAAITHWESTPDRGQSHAINKGFLQATGDFCGWINSDDLLEPGCLATVAEWFEENPSKGWLVGSARIVDADGLGEEIRRPGDINIESMIRWCTGTWFAQQATFWRRDAVPAGDLLREDLHYCMDWDLWLRLFHRCGPPGTIENVVASYRFHEDAKCVSETGNVWREYYYLLRDLAAGQHETSQTFGQPAASFLAEEALSLGRKLQHSRQEVEILQKRDDSLRRSSAHLARLILERLTCR